ncbi:MAG: hypothetical protein ACKOCM_12880, partial [Cyanobacteriota bacterium]
MAPALNVADGTSLATARALLGDSAFRLQVGILDIPALADGSATWADIDNDGDVDLLLSGLEASTGLLTTQLLRNPLVGGGSSFEQLSIALPGLQRAVASWGDIDLDGDLDLAVSGVQGTAELPYLQVFRNTTSQRLSDPVPGEPPFAGNLNRRPDRPDAISTVWNGAQAAVQLAWSFSHLTNDDAPYTYNLAVGRAPRTGNDRVAPGQGLVFDQIAPLADPLSGERRIATAGNQGFHNQGLFSAGLPGETYHWSVQAIDKGFRGSVWTDGQDFTIQPLQPQLLSDTNPVLQGRSRLAPLTAAVATELRIDFDSDGLRDRIRYDTSSRRLLVDQGAGHDGTTWRPFLGPTGALIAYAPTFLATLPVGASDVTLQLVDRSVLVDSAEGQWTLSVDLDGPAGSAASEQVLTSFRSGDPLGQGLDLAGDLLTRQRYRLEDVPAEVRLFLNGQDVRADLGDGQHANLSFTLEDARSGALRFLFSDPTAASAGDITLKLVPASGSGPASYNLRLQDRGDGRPDLLVGWADGRVDGTPPRSFAVVSNQSVRGNTDPPAPQLIGLKRLSGSGAPSLRVHWQPGSDLESPAVQLRHQWRVIGGDASTPSPWKDIPATEADGSLLLSAAALSAAGLADALQPGTQLHLELRVLDAGDREARSTPAALNVPTLPPADTRPSLIGLTGVRLLEGDNLQHRGSDLLPLQLRQRLVAVDPGGAGSLAGDATIHLQLPDWLLTVGSFVLRDADGSVSAAPVATPVTGKPDLRQISLQAEQLDRLASRLARKATGRAPLSLQWRQTFSASGSTPLELSQPLELRFRDGGDRIPATSTLCSNSSPGDTWILTLPEAAQLVDGVSGRSLSLGSFGAALADVKLPGWAGLFGDSLRDGDLRIASSSDGTTRQLMVSGARARTLIDGLQLLHADALAGRSLQLTYTPAGGLPGASPVVILGPEALAQPLKLDGNLAGDGRDLLSLRADLTASGDAISRVALLPLQVRSDRDLLIPFSVADGLGSVSITRVDGASDGAVLSLSGPDQFRLDLPSLPGAPLA